MAIVVEHGDPSVNNALNMLLAQLQNRQRAEDDLAKLTQAFYTAPQYVSQAPEGVEPVDRSPLPRPTVPQPASYGPPLPEVAPTTPIYSTQPAREPRGSYYSGRRGGRYADPLNLFGTGNDSILLQQIRDANDNEQQRFAAEQQMAMEQMRQAGRPEDDLPDWIQQGLSDQTLYYTPANRRERDEHEEAIDKIQSSPRFSAAEKAYAIAEHKAEIRRLDNDARRNPNPPQTPQQQFEQGVVTLPGPDGTPRRYFLGQRSGSLNPIPLDQDVDKAALDQQKLELSQIKAEQDRTAAVEKVERDAAEAEQTRRLKAEEKIQELKLKALEARMPREAQYTTTVEGLKKTDTAGYLAALDKWQKDMESLTNSMINGMQSPSQAPPTAPPVVPPQAAPTPEPPQPQASQPDKSKWPVVTDNSGVERVVVDSEEESRALGLPDGTPTINSQGRTATWYN